MHNKHLDIAELFKAACGRQTVLTGSYPGGTN
jgi:hypothetical protein